MDRGLILLSRIRCIITDVDGVLTDGGLHYGPEGECLKRFSVYDGLGISLARKAGIKIGVLSERDCPALRVRLRDLGISAFRLGKLDKISVLQDLCRELNSIPQECAFVGDDLPDIPCFAACALGVAVANARPEAKAAANMVLSTPGGQGALRELIDMIRATR